MRLGRQKMPEAQRASFWQTLTTFTVTRLLIALLLLVFLSLNSTKPSGDLEQLIYWQTCIVYLLLSVGFAGCALFYRRGLLIQLAVQISVDIAVVSILYFSAGGGKSGLAILYLFPLAGGAILAPQLLAFFFAAVVTLMLLGESTYALLQLSGDASVSQAGLYGAAFFVAVFAINRLAARLIKQENLAVERGNELRLQESINRLIIADTGDGILVVGHDGTVITSNPAAEKMLGMVMPQESPLLVLSDYATLAPIAAAFARWLAGPGSSPINNNSLSSGSTAVHDVEVEQASTFVLIKPADFGIAAATQNAWAGRRELTVHLKLRFARVASEYASNNRSVIFMRDVSEIDNQAQQLKLAAMGRLTASIAHEVRNPLSAISYSASLLREESRDPAQTRLLEIVTDNVTRLNRMIEDILRLSRKANRPNEPLPLAPTIARILAEFLETHPVSHDLIHVAPIDIHYIWFDAIHFQEVLVNLLSNALRYASGEPGSIRLDVTATSAARLELHVKDDGASISPQVRAHLFEPFYTTSSKGTGLGLYLARELCLNNGAVLDYEYRTDIAPDTSVQALYAQASETPFADSQDVNIEVAEPSGRFVITVATARDVVGSA
ncbi:MAG: ATP-binding protein [Pseudomonadota bacterium]